MPDGDEAVRADRLRFVAVLAIVRGEGPDANTRNDPTPRSAATVRYVLDFMVSSRVLSQTEGGLPRLASENQTTDETELEGAGIQAMFLRRTFA